MQSRWWITGARGFLGSALVRAFQAEGIPVGEWVRNPAASPLGTERREWKLGDGAPASTREHGLAGVVHAAWDFSELNPVFSENLNVRGALRLLEDCKRAQVPFVFISSLSAFDGCETQYGRSKWEIERHVLAYERGWVVAPGLIWSRDGKNGGMVGALTQAVRKLPLVGVPRIDRKNLSVVELGELSKSVAGLARAILDSRTESLPRRIVGAAGDKVRFVQVIRALAKREQSRAKIFELPLALFLFPLTVLELLRVPTRFKKDSLLSLTQLPETDEGSSQAVLRAQWYPTRLVD